MARIYAQHATAGQYHLETHYSGHEWEWWAKAIRPATGLPEFSGTAKTLEAAKRSAMARIGLTVDPGWGDIGPPIDLPD